MSRQAARPSRRALRCGGGCSLSCFLRSTSARKRSTVDCLATSAPSSCCAKVCSLLWPDGIVADSPAASGVGSANGADVLALVDGWARPSSRSRSQPIFLINPLRAGKAVRTVGCPRRHSPQREARRTSPDHSSVHESPLVAMLVHRVSPPTAGVRRSNQRRSTTHRSALKSRRAAVGSFGRLRDTIPSGCSRWYGSVPLQTFTHGHHASDVNVCIRHGHFCCACYLSSTSHMGSAPAQEAPRMAQA